MIAADRQDGHAACGHDRRRYERRSERSPFFEVIGSEPRVDAESDRMKQIGRGQLTQGWVAEGLRAVGVLGKDEKL